jgi:hypothetical protein
VNRKKLTDLQFSREHWLAFALRPALIALIKFSANTFTFRINPQRRRTGPALAREQFGGLPPPLERGQSRTNTSMPR